jgi:hypothetical protein
LLVKSIRLENEIVLAFSEITRLDETCVQARTGYLPR